LLSFTIQQMATNFFYPWFLESSFDQICTRGFVHFLLKNLWLYFAIVTLIFFLHNLKKGC
jgi:hypothetical protein